MRPSVFAIANAVGFAMGGVPVSDIRSRSRTKSIVRARQVTLYVARAELGLSFADLAREVSMNHTSMISAVSRVAKGITEGDRSILAGVAAGERAAVQWATNGPMSEESLRARRREISMQLRELVAEAHRVDGMIADCVRKSENDGRAVAAE